MTLERFIDSTEAQSFFAGIRDLTKLKRAAIHSQLAKDQEQIESIEIQEASEKATKQGKEKLEKQKQDVQKHMRNLEVIDQYCDYILNKDKEGYKVDLMVDE